MLNSLYAATRGLILGKLPLGIAAIGNLPLGIATDGLIYLPVSAYSPPPYLSHGHGGWPDKRPRWEHEEIRKRIFEDDKEILEIIMSMVLSGRLN
jgi:hypothetical protein